MEDTSFIVQNEQDVNAKVSKFMWWTLAVAPLLALGYVTGAFPFLRFSEIVLYFLMLLCLCAVINLMCRKDSSRSYIKYFCVMSLELVVCLGALSKGLCLFISYIFVPLFSNIYFSRKFTMKVSIISYVFMMATLVYRCLNPIPAYFGNLTRIDWIKAYGFGLSIEYLIFSIVNQLIAGSLSRNVRVQHSMVEKLTEINSELKMTNYTVLNMQKKIINLVANVVEFSDQNTGEHIKRTSFYVLLLSQTMKDMDIYSAELTSDFIETLVATAPLHDVGKIGIPDAILRKKSSLTPEEYEVIKGHTVLGANLIIQNMPGLETESYVSIAKNIALSHHERWDGSGYPSGLRGYDIPLCARIMAVADVLDALLNSRSYKDSMPLEEAFAIMKRDSGTHFDPLIIDALEKSLDQVQMYIDTSTGLEEI